MDFRECGRCTNTRRVYDEHTWKEVGDDERHHIVLKPYTPVAYWYAANELLPHAVESSSEVCATRSGAWQCAL